MAWWCSHLPESIEQPLYLAEFLVPKYFNGTLHLQKEQNKDSSVKNSNLGRLLIVSTAAAVFGRNQTIKVVYLQCWSQGAFIGISICEEKSSCFIMET